MDRHFLDIADLSRGEIEALLVRAAEFKRLRREGGLPRPLVGQVWGLLFEKASTRTRVSFEVGILLLGGTPLFMAGNQLQMSRGETLEDTARILSRYVDGLIVRTSGHERVTTLARHASIPVINGLTDRSHPCQVLADLQTVAERLGGLAGTTMAWVGDGNNVAYSWIEAAMLLDFTLHLACPPQYRPQAEILNRAQAAGARIKVFDDPREAVRKAQVISTDVWVSMGQETEAAERLRAFRPYQVNAGLVAQARPGAVVLHCLPAHRGEEITDEVIDGPQSAVFDQGENRLYGQMAVMERLAQAWRKKG